MSINIKELQRLHAEAAKSLAAFEASVDPKDQETRGLPKWRCVRDRIFRIGEALDGRCALKSLDFIDSLWDMRGLYWDSPETPTEEQALKDAAALFLRLFDDLGGKRRG